MQPWKANINGKEYEYQSGITAEVPDEVAALIDFIDDSAPKRDPKAAQRAIEGEVTQIVKDSFAGGVGYEETAEGVMLPETSFEIVAGNFHATISNSFPYTFEVGQDYTVTFDGVTNTYTAIAGQGGLGALTNTSLNDFAAGNGWLIAVDTGACGFLTMDTSLVGAHTISISGVATNIYKIDEKYLGKITFKMDKMNPVGEGAFSLNRKADTDIGDYSFAEGHQTTASGDSSHAEGYNTTASGGYSHAEGYGTTASGDSSHAEGSGTASGDYSHAEGENTTASGKSSHAEGHGTIAASKCQHVQGKFNIEDSNDVYAHIIGGGTLGNDRKNIHTVDWSGNAWYAGTVEGKALIIASSTAGSTKRFKVTVNDAGTLTATEVTS